MRLVYLYGRYLSFPFTAPYVKRVLFVTTFLVTFERILSYTTPEFTVIHNNSSQSYQRLKWKPTSSLYNSFPPQLFHSPRQRGSEKNQIKLASHVSHKPLGQCRFIPLEDNTS